MEYNYDGCLFLNFGAPFHYAQLDHNKTVRIEDILAVYLSEFRLFFRHAK